MVVHVFDYSTWEAEPGSSLEFEGSLDYIMNFRTAKATQRHCLNKPKTKAGPSVAGNSCNLAALDAETGGLKAQELSLL